MLEFLSSWKFWLHIKFIVSQKVNSYVKIRRSMNDSYVDFSGY